jgi:sulfate adenylyltransferase subunit 1 (EFTu-like GTPase family)
MDMNTLHRQKDNDRLTLNEIGWVTLRLTQPRFCDPYRQSGELILIDEANHAPVDVAMITDGRHRGGGGSG